MERPSPEELRDVWCVVPVYNAGRTVEAVVRACRAELPNVVVVDDGSTDADIPALFVGSDIAVLRHPVNRGKGCAIRTALEYVRRQGGRFMITVDADGQHDPRDIRAFLPRLADDTQVIIGRRRMRDGGAPWRSRFGRAFSDLWLRIETGQVVRDSQSGFRAYPVRLLSQLRLRGRRYEFEVEVLVKAAWAGLTLASVEVGVTYEPAERRVSHFRGWQDNGRIAAMHSRLVSRRLLPWPHRRLVRRPLDLKSLFLRQPRDFFRAMLSEHATPGGLAASAAVGTTLAVLPLISFHSVAILYVTSRLNLNRLMALAIQNLYMPPFAPMLCIEIGYYLRHGRWLTVLNRQTALLEIHERVFEWFLGSLLVAPVAAALAAGVVYAVAAALQRRGPRDD